MQQVQQAAIEQHMIRFHRRSMNKNFFFPNFNLVSFSDFFCNGFISLIDSDWFRLSLINLIIQWPALLG